MNAIIITTGKELLLGHVRDYNSYNISKNLSNIGINIQEHVTIDDDFDKIIDLINKNVKIYDIIILTGGLGPTDDDITKEAIAKALSKEIIINNPDNKVYDIIEGTINIVNHNGTAYGIHAISINGTDIFALPGPPNENTDMITDYINPYLSKKVNNSTVIRNYSIMGNYERQIVSMIKPILKKYESDISLTTYIEYPITNLKFITTENKVAKETQDNIDKEIKDIFKENIITTNVNETLENVVFNLLNSNNLTLSIAESCTGGLLASKIVNIPGSSKVLNESIVCYTPESKINRELSKSETISTYGVVSEQVANELAKNIKSQTNADIGIGITGFAGPDNGTEKDPVGTIYYTIATNKLHTRKISLLGDRNTIREKACVYVLNELRLLLLRGIDE